MNRFLSALCCCGVLATVPLQADAAMAQEAKSRVESASSPEELLASRFVQVVENGAGYQLRYGDTLAEFNLDTLDLAIEADGVKWEFRTPSLAQVRQDGKDYSLDLATAASRKAMLEEFGPVAGVKVRLADFTVDGVKLDLAVTLFVGIDWTNGEVIAEVRPDEGKAALRVCHWPGAIDGGDAEDSVIPFMQGMMIPRDWPEKFDAPYSDGPGYGMVYGRNLYMPWWGVEKDHAGLMMLLDTPIDAGVAMRHSPEEGTVLEPKWLHTMGRLDYTRKARLIPVKGNYVQMAQRYRDYLKERGEFVTIEEKIARTPSVDELFGAPIVHTQAEYTNMRDTDHPEGVSWNIPYSKHIENMQKLKAAGIAKLYLHIDGVGFRGYDNLEPDQLPVGKNAGGVEGLRQMLATAKELDYLIVYHQQYRDFYLDAASYSEELVKRNEDNSIPIDDYWAGGKNAMVCPLRSQEYTRRNNMVLELLDAPVDGCYLDVFAVVPADECYNPEHKVDRTQCYNLRRQCFGYIKNKWGIVSSEEPVGWAVPYLDLVHHAPWPVTPQKSSFGILLPLHTLVYHDSIVIPWDSETRRGKSYYFSNEETPYLHTLLNAGMPYISEEASPAEVERVKVAADLHRRIGKEPMVNHEILDENGRHQRATYADGTTVETNQNTRTARISFPDGSRTEVKVLDDETGDSEITRH